MIKNEDWINEVLRLTDVEIRRESDESVGKPRETRTQKTKRLNTEAQQLKKRAKDQQEDYDLLCDNTWGKVYKELAKAQVMKTAQEPSFFHRSRQNKVALTLTAPHRRPPLALHPQ